MCQWTATAQANATPEQLLEILTHPEEIRRWSPVDFRVADLAGRRLAAGTRTRVTGRLAGVSVTFDVEVHAADAARLELSADGPIGLDVRYDVASSEAGAELTACVRRCCRRERWTARPGESSRPPNQSCAPRPDRAPPVMNRARGAERLPARSLAVAAIRCPTAPARP